MSDMSIEPKSQTLGLSRRWLFFVPAMLGLVATPVAAHTRRARLPLRVRLTLQDRTEIQDLFSAYLWAYDCSDEEGFLDLFTEEGMVVGRGRHHIGREAMRAWFRYLLNLRDTAGDLWLHVAAQFRFEGDGNTCVVYAYATHFRSHPASEMLGVRSLGYFVNECVKVDGAWKFRRLSISSWDNNAQPWKKPKPWDVPSTP